MSDNTEGLDPEYIESGAYYIAARNWYGTMFTTPITQSSYFIIIIFLCAINFYFALNAVMGVFPIKAPAPLIIYSDNIVEDYPAIHLIESPDHDNNNAVMVYLLQTYVKSRESYKLSLFEQRYHNVWGSSSAGVFAQYAQEVDPSNPHSPYRQYAALTEKEIQIQSVSYHQEKEESHAQIVFTAVTKSSSDFQETGHSEWQADITYEYTPLSVEQRLEKHAALANFFFHLTGTAGKDSADTRPADDSSLNVTPMKLVVTGYKVKELLE